jgi:hypothetical protein
MKSLLVRIFQFEMSARRTHPTGLSIDGLDVANEPPWVECRSSVTTSRGEMMIERVIAGNGLGRKWSWSETDLASNRFVGMTPRDRNEPGQTRLLAHTGRQPRATAGDFP